MKYKKLMICLLLVFVILVINHRNKVYAVSATAGNNVKVTYNITSPDGGNLSTVTGKVTYDSNKLQYVSISSSAGITNGTAVSATESQINGKSMSVTVTYKVKDGITGNIETSLVISELYTTESDSNYAAKDKKIIPVTINSTEKTNNTDSNKTNNSNHSNNSTSTEKNANTTKSNNANLSNLGIKPNDFKGFKASKTSYDVTVPNDVEKITVYATAQDNKAKIKGNESQKLKVGKNTLNVVVTAEDGTQKTYTINVTREEANQTEENTSNTTTNETSSEKTQETQSETNSDLKNLSIKGYTLNPSFSPNVYEYKVDVNGDVSSLDIETEGSSHNVSVDIVGNENLTEGENTITILVYNEETKQNSTYQIIVNKTNLDMTDINKTMNDAAKKAQKVRYIIFGILAFIVVCIIAFVIVKKRLENKDEDDNDEDVELPKAIRNNDENDEEELQHNKTRKKGRHF